MCPSSISIPFVTYVPSLFQLPIAFVICPNSISIAFVTYVPSFSMFLIKFL